MKFSASLVVLAATGALAATKPTYATVVTDLKTTLSKLTTFNKTLNTFKGDINTAVTLENEATDIQNALNQTLMDTKAAPYFGDAGSLSFAQEVLVLYPAAVSVINNLIAHKPYFQKPNDLTGVVGSALASEANLVASLGTAATSKLNPAFQAAAPCLINQLNSAFATGEKAFPTSS